METCFSYIDRGKNSGNFSKQALAATKKLDFYQCFLDVWRLELADFKVPSNPRHTSVLILCLTSLFIGRRRVNNEHSFC